MSDVVWGGGHKRWMERWHLGSPQRPEQVVGGAQWDMLAWVFSIRTHSTNSGATRELGGGLRQHGRAGMLQNVLWLLPSSANRQMVLKF